MNSLLKKTLCRVTAFAFSASIGAILFSSVERPNAQNESEEKVKLLNSLKEMGIKYNMTQTDFDNFTQLSYDALSMRAPAWDYVDGLRFAFETLTTIGYGHLSPSTRVGQALCIVFAVLGIPVTILAFKSVGELISLGITSVIAQIEKQCFKREPSNVEAKCTAVTFVLMLIMLLCGAWLKIEDWTFLEGFYFWFITLTTIGYGDYVPDKHSGSGWRIAAHLVWTTMGLCVVSSVLNALVAFMEKRKPCTVCSCFNGNRELEDTGKNGENDNEKEKNGNGIDGNEKNGMDASRVDCNGTGDKEENQYHSVTYV